MRVAAGAGSVDPSTADRVEDDVIGREGGLRRAAIITTTMGAASVGGVLVVALAAHAADAAKATTGSSGTSASTNDDSGTGQTSRSDDHGDRFYGDDGSGWPPLFSGGGSGSGHATSGGS
jgi:hypothetical protein